LIHEILIHKGIVEYYDSEIKNFLLTYSQSAEILLSIYEVKDDFGKNQKSLPKSLTVEKIIYFDNSLFSKPEQAYFNYFLNKSLDLRNSYLHGTQATPDEIQKHEYAYFTYLKLLILIFLKIEDDLIIYKAVKNRP